MIFGVEPVRELILAAPDAVRVLYVKRGREDRFAYESERVSAAGGSVRTADAAALDRLAGAHARHQGLVAVMKRRRYADFNRSIAERPDPIVLIDGITDPRNLGALLRSAEGAGVRTVIIARDRTVALTPLAVKSSAGAWVHLTIARCANVARAIGLLKKAGYWIAAMAPGGEVSLYDLDVSRPLVLVVGSEGGGVREKVRKSADFVVGIPMQGKVESLNVSVAVAVVLFEVVRRRAQSRKTRVDSEEQGRAGCRAAGQAGLREA